MWSTGVTVRPLRGRRVWAGESEGRAAARCTRRARPTAAMKHGRALTPAPRPFHPRGYAAGVWGTITSTAPWSQRIAECTGTACAAETAVSRETPLSALDSRFCGLQVSPCPVSAKPWDELRRAGGALTGCRAHTSSTCGGLDSAGARAGRDAARNVACARFDAAREAECQPCTDGLRVRLSG